MPLPLVGTILTPCPPPSSTHPLPVVSINPFLPLPLKLLLPCLTAATTALLVELPTQSPLPVLLLLPLLPSLRMALTTSSTILDSVHLPRRRLRTLSIPNLLRTLFLLLNNASLPLLLPLLLLSKLLLSMTMDGERILMTIFLKSRLPLALLLLPLNLNALPFNNPLPKLLDNKSLNSNNLAPTRVLIHQPPFRMPVLLLP